MPARRASARRAAAAASSSSSDAARVASIVTLMPPASYGAPAIRAANSDDAVAGEHEVGVAVDEAGDHAGAAGVDALVAGRRRPGADGEHAAAVDHDVGVAELTVGGVRHEQADAVDDRRGELTHPNVTGRRGPQGCGPRNFSRWAVSKYS